MLHQSSILKNQINHTYLKIYDESPTKIENLINVWCLTLLTENDKLAILNIVQTGEKSKTTNN